MLHFPGVREKVIRQTNIRRYNAKVIPKDESRCKFQVNPHSRSGDLSPPELSKEFADNLYQQVLATWVNPEVRRRLEAGTIQGDTAVWAAQVLFDPSGPESVRLNDEVNGEFHVRSSELSNLEVTQENLHALAGEIVAFHLPLDDAPNAGHITLMFHKKGFFITFDFQYNSERITEHLVTAREYLDTANRALESGSVRPAVANLHIAVELMAKATLLRHPDPILISSKSHEYVASRYNRYSHQGNTEPRFAQLLNALADTRNPARYPTGAFGVGPNRATAWLRDAEEMYAWLLRAVPIRTRLKVLDRSA